MSSRPRKTRIEARREERELFFWTASEAIRLVAKSVLVAYVLVSLIAGELPGGELLLRAFS